MKRIAIIILFCFLLVTPLIVYADAIAEPDNSFFQKNRDKIIYLGRSFVANGENGSVPVKNEPGAGRSAMSIQNGDVVFIEFTCLFDGDFWGFASYTSPSGWVRMDQVLIIYDYVAFEEEYMGEFYPYEGDFGEIEKTKSAVAWAWPGSGRPLWTITDIEMDYFSVTHAWMDPDGREWGFLLYMLGSRNIWVCLSDPLNNDLPVFKPEPEPAVWIPDTVHQEIEPAGNRTILIIVILVAAIAATTMILIRVLWKQGKDLSKDKEKTP